MLADKNRELLCQNNTADYIFTLEYVWPISELQAN